MQIKLIVVVVVKIPTWPSSSRSIKREILKETEVSKRAVKENEANF